VEFDVLLPIALADAEIRVLPPAAARTVRVRFILKTLALTNENVYSETGVAGLGGELLQFVHGRARTLSAVLHFDGRATDTDVRQLMKEVTDLMHIDRSLHAPPVLSFEWTGLSFKCVLERSVLESISSLFPDGRPSRGHLRVTFKELLTVEELLQEAGLQ
jgi:hypothetical protein